MFISARSVENCISVERLNTLNTDFCKISRNLPPAKQGLFSLIPEAAVHITFAVNLARFFRTPILYYIIIYKVGVLKNLAKFKGKPHCWNHFLIKLQVSGVQFY